VRKFVSTLEEATPALADPWRRKTALNAALDLADELSSALMSLQHSIVRSASEALSGKPGGTKE
jgi:hypothetical protein